MRKKKIPTFRNDTEAEKFVAESDLTDYDLSGFKSVHFEFDKKTAKINMRLPEKLLDAVKTKASERGIPYQRWIRETLERAVVK